MEKVEEPLIYLRVSNLSHAEFCNKRSKIESFGGSSHYSNYSSNHPIAIGNKLHIQYSYLGYDLDAAVVLSLLERYLIRGALQKQIDNIVIRGLFDNLRVIIVDGKKYSVLSELKTIMKKDLWNRELRAFIRQLQLYMWLIKDLLEEIGFPLWKRGYLEVYSQKTGYRLMRIPVEYDDNIEEWIRDIVRKFKGLSKILVPHLAYCKRCPSQVKEVCSWWIMRKPNRNI